MLHIESGTVEGAVGRDLAQHFADGMNAAFTRGFSALDHQRRGAHAHNQAVTALVEWSGGFFDHFVRGCRSARQEARAEPFDHVVGGDIVGRDDDDALAAAGANPVLRQRNRLRRGRAGGVDLRVGTARADVLGELRVPHRQSPEEEAPVEDIWLCSIAVRNSSMRCATSWPSAECPFALCALHFSSIANSCAARAIGVIARHDLGKGVVARERRAHDHARVIAQSVGQAPAVGKLSALGRGLVAHDQRNAGIAQGVDSGSNGQAGNAIERGQAIGGDAKLVFHIEWPAATGKLDDVGDIADQLEGRLAVLALHQAGDVLVEHGAAEAVGYGGDELIAVQQTRDVAVVEDVLGSGQAEGCAGDDHRLVFGAGFWP